MITPIFSFFLFPQQRRFSAYCALWAIFYIVDRKLDLSLLSDHRVLKERDAAQVDGITGGLYDRARQKEVSVFQFCIRSK